MKELPERIHDDTNGLDYVLVGDYYIPALRLTEESRPIGHWAFWAFSKKVGIMPCKGGIERNF